MDIVDFVDEVPGGLDRIHELADEVGGIELEAHMGRLAKALEQRFIAGGAGRNVQDLQARLPTNANLVFLAGRKVLLRVDADDLLHLRLERFSGSLPDIAPMGAALRACRQVQWPL